jgi:phenylacetate-CoA ligase
MLHWLREHPHAPRWNFATGDRLNADDLAAVQEYERELNSSHTGCEAGEFPKWLSPFVGRCLVDVPFYRRRGGIPEDYSRIPTCLRKDLAREPWSFVPDSAPLDDLIVYATSGATGSPLHVLSHPTAMAKYLPLLKKVLARFGVNVEAVRDGVALVNVCAQKETAVIPAVSSYLGQAGVAKINLSDQDWNDPEDAARFLDACDSPIYLGDPISFEKLSTLSLATRPKALLSTGMSLLPGLREKLRERFRCPVINYYSMTESGPIAVETEEGWEILPHDLYVEVVDKEGNPSPPGVRGEITLTGGRNPFLPLLRYRTGDWGALERRDGRPMLVALEGREPVVFRTSDGREVNNIDVSHALAPFALPQFHLHQPAAGPLRLEICGEGHPLREIDSALRNLFGDGMALETRELSGPDVWEDKVVPFTSDL